MTSWKPSLFFLKKSKHLGKVAILGQILEKPSVRFRGHIFSPIIMLFGQNVFLDEMSDEFENASCHVKKLGHLVKS